MIDPREYPRELSEAEIDLGFQILEIDGLGEWFRDFLPAVAVIRPESRMRREQASELLLNAYGSDFVSRERAEGI